MTDYTRLMIVSNHWIIYDAQIVVGSYFSIQVIKNIFRFPLLAYGYKILEIVKSPLSNSVLWFLFNYNRLFLVLSIWEIWFDGVSFLDVDAIFQGVAGHATRSAIYSRRKHVIFRYAIVNIDSFKFISSILMVRSSNRRGFPSLDTSLGRIRTWSFLYNWILKIFQSLFAKVNVMPVE